MHIQCPLGDWYSLLHLKQVRYQARRHRPLSDNIERFHPHKMPRSQVKRRSCRSKTDFHFLQKEKSESNMAGKKTITFTNPILYEPKFMQKKIKKKIFQKKISGFLFCATIYSQKSSPSPFSPPQ